MSRVLRYPNGNVAAFNAHLLALVSETLGVRPRTLRSSELRGVGRAKGQDGILEICRTLKASCYVNPIGGVGLYDEGAFEQSGVALRFLRTRVPPVALVEGAAHLSVIDAFMHQGPEGCAALLPCCEVLAPSNASSPL